MKNEYKQKKCVQDTFTHVISEEIIKSVRHSFIYKTNNSFSRMNMVRNKILCRTSLPKINKPWEKSSHSKY